MDQISGKYSKGAGVSLPVMDLNRALAATQILAETPSFNSIGDSHPKLIAELKRLDLARTASMFAALLLLPGLQSNCLRIEVLVHLALAYCNGRSAPTAAFVRRAFEELGSGFCGRLEDPAEDVFASLVHTPSGNFRIFEGIREGTTFYLQRILNIVQKMPSAPPFDDIRASVESLLRLSDAVADRSGVLENSLGHEVPLDSLPKDLINRCALARNFVRFDKADLRRLGVSQTTLREFVYRADLRSRNSFQAQRLGHTDLERCPILAFGGSHYLALPTAVASAITRFVIETVMSLGNEEVFVTELAREFGQLFAETRLLGGPSRAPIHFQRLPSGRIGAVMTEVDPGRFLHLVFSVDGLSGFDRDGLAGINPEFMTASSAISEHLKLASNSVAGQPTFRDGIMVVVNCGFGRGACFGIKGPHPNNWRFESIPAHDLITLSWLSEFRPLTLWSLLDSQETIKGDGTALLNVNGLLNLVAWARELDGHIVPQGQTPNVLRRSDGKRLVVVRQNAIRDLRHAVLIDCDARRILDSDGRWVKVRKLDKSEFDEDNRAPLYGSEEDVLKGILRAVFLAPLRPWWIEIIPPHDASHDSVFERWQMLCAWLHRAAPVLDEAYPGLPTGAVSVQVRFAEIVGLTHGDVRSKDYEELCSLFQVVANAGSPVVRINVGKGFDDGLAQAENVAEHALVEALVAGISTASGESADTNKRADLVGRICPNSRARWTHRIMARSFRDFVQASREKPVLLDSIDDAANRLGLAWTVHSRESDPEILGVSQCKACLNAVVRIVLDRLCGTLKKFDRRLFVNAVLQNHEAAAYDRDRWKRTAQANLALHDDKNAAIRTIVNHLSKVNACFLTSRILLEAAICECPVDTGQAPGTLDLSRMMSQAMLVFTLGGWSDAIHWGAMEPHLRISSWGDVHVDQSFMDTVYEPFGRGNAESEMKRATDSYAELYGPAEVTPSVAELLEPEFCDAWKAEFGVAIDGTRAFLDRVENFALESNKLIFNLPQSALARMLADSSGISLAEACSALGALILAPRPEWRTVNAGFRDKDWFPWRFRRRLSVLRRPIIRIDDEEDPTLVLAPGIIGEGLHAMMRWFHRGEIPPPQVRSHEMCKWIGYANNVQRSKFNSTVAAKMRELGWQADHEVKVTKILGRSFERDYGDIDVLAWNTSSGRILVMECKDLQFHKSIGEVAEQFSDFRGEIRTDGRPDHLKRHLDRLEILAAHVTTVSRALGMTAGVYLEGHLVFKNPVPMKFAWDHMRSRVHLSLFDELDRL